MASTGESRNVSQPHHLDSPVVPTSALYPTRGPTAHNWSPLAPSASFPYSILSWVAPRPAAHPPSVFTSSLSPAATTTTTTTVKSTTLVEPQWPFVLNVGGRIFAFGPGTVARSALLSAVVSTLYQKPLAEPRQFSSVINSECVVLHDTVRQERLNNTVGTEKTHNAITRSTDQKITTLQAPLNATSSTGVPFIDRDSDEFALLVEYSRTGELSLLGAAAKGSESKAAENQTTTYIISPRQCSASQTSEQFLLIRKLRQSFQFYGVVYPQLCDHCNVLFDPTRNDATSCVFHESTLQKQAEQSEGNRTGAPTAYSCCGLPENSLGCCVGTHIAAAQLFPSDNTTRRRKTLERQSSNSSKSKRRRQKSKNDVRWPSTSVVQQQNTMRTQIKKGESQGLFIADCSFPTASTGLDSAIFDHGTSSYGFGNFQSGLGSSGQFLRPSMEVELRGLKTLSSQRSRTIDDDSGKLKDKENSCHYSSCCPCRCLDEWSCPHWPSHSPTLRLLTPRHALRGRAAQRSKTFDETYRTNGSFSPKDSLSSFPVKSFVSLEDSVMQPPTLPQENVLLRHQERSPSTSQGHVGGDNSPIAALSPRPASHSGSFFPSKLSSCPQMDNGCFFPFGCIAGLTREGLHRSSGCEMDIESIDFRRSGSSISWCTAAGDTNALIELPTTGISAPSTAAHPHGFSRQAFKHRDTYDESLLPSDFLPSPTKPERVGLSYSPLPIDRNKIVGARHSAHTQNAAAHGKKNQGVGQQEPPTRHIHREGNRTPSENIVQRDSNHRRHSHLSQNSVGIDSCWLYAMRKHKRKGGYTTAQQDQASSHMGSHHRSVEPSEIQPAKTLTNTAVSQQTTQWDFLSRQKTHQRQKPLCALFFPDNTTRGHDKPHTCRFLRSSVEARTVIDSSSPLDLKEPPLNANLRTDSVAQDGNVVTPMALRIYEKNLSKIPPEAAPTDAATLLAVLPGNPWFPSTSASLLGDVYST